MDVDLKSETSLGFGNNITPKQYNEITVQDIISFGMIPELIGRFPNLISMNTLTLEDYIKILNSKDASVLTRQEKFLHNNGIELILEPGTIEAIAKAAIILNSKDNNFGARSLDTIVSKLLSDAKFAIAFEPETFKQLIISPDTVTDSKKYVLKK